MNIKSHPIGFLKEALPKSKQIILEFSRYRYKPQSLFDDRSIFSLNYIELTDDWLSKTFDSLLPDEELAIHSAIKVDGKRYHIPMIDFCCTPKQLEEAKRIVSKLLPNNISSTLNFYDSGRSMHAYAASLLSPKEWIKFNGRLLLCNLPNKEPIVDSRWIGHRIIAGYSSLRISCNTPTYKKMPVKI